MRFPNFKPSDPTLTYTSDFRFEVDTNFVAGTSVLTKNAVKELIYENGDVDIVEFGNNRREVEASITLVNIPFAIYTHLLTYLIESNGKYIPVFLDKGELIFGADIDPYSADSRFQVSNNMYLQVSAVVPKDETFIDQYDIELNLKYSNDSFSDTTTDTSVSGQAPSIEFLVEIILSAYTVADHLPSTTTNFSAYSYGDILELEDPTTKELTYKVLVQDIDGMIALDITSSVKTIAENRLILKDNLALNLKNGVIAFSSFGAYNYPLANGNYFQQLGGVASGNYYWSWENRYFVPNFIVDHGIEFPQKNIGMTDPYGVENASTFTIKLTNNIRTHLKTIETNLDAANVTIWAVLNGTPQKVCSGTIQQISWDSMSYNLECELYSFLQYDNQVPTRLVSDDYPEIADTANEGEIRMITNGAWAWGKLQRISKIAPNFNVSGIVDPNNILNTTDSEIYAQILPFWVDSPLISAAVNNQSQIDQTKITDTLLIAIDFGSTAKVKEFLDYIYPKWDSVYNLDGGLDRFLHTASAYPLYGSDSGDVFVNVIAAPAASDTSANSTGGLLDDVFVAVGLSLNVSRVYSYNTLISVYGASGPKIDVLNYTISNPDNVVVLQVPTLLTDYSQDPMSVMQVNGYTVSVTKKSTLYSIDWRHQRGFELDSNGKAMVYKWNTDGKNYNLLSPDLFNVYDDGSHYNNLLKPNWLLDTTSVVTTPKQQLLGYNEIPYTEEITHNFNLTSSDVYPLNEFTRKPNSGATLNIDSISKNFVWAKGQVKSPFMDKTINANQLYTIISRKITATGYSNGQLLDMQRLPMRGEGIKQFNPPTQLWDGSYPPTGYTFAQVLSDFGVVNSAESLSIASLTLYSQFLNNPPSLDFPTLEQEALSSLARYLYGIIWVNGREDSEFVSGLLEDLSGVYFRASIASLPDLGLNTPVPQDKYSWSSSPNSTDYLISASSRSKFDTEFMKENTPRVAMFSFQSNKIYQSWLAMVNYKNNPLLDFSLWNNFLVSESNQAVAKLFVDGVICSPAVYNYVNNFQDLGDYVSDYFSLKLDGSTNQYITFPHLQGLERAWYPSGYTMKPYFSGVANVGYLNPNIENILVSHDYVLTDNIKSSLQGLSTDSRVFLSQFIRIACTPLETSGFYAGFHNDPNISGDFPHSNGTYPSTIICRILLRHKDPSKNRVIGAEQMVLGTAGAALGTDAPSDFDCNGYFIAYNLRSIMGGSDRFTYKGTTETTGAINLSDDILEYMNLTTPVSRVNNFYQTPNDNNQAYIDNKWATLPETPATFFPCEGLIFPKSLFNEEWAYFNDCVGFSIQYGAWGDSSTLNGHAPSTSDKRFGPYNPALQEDWGLEQYHLRITYGSYDFGGQKAGDMGVYLTTSLVSLDQGDQQLFVKIAYGRDEASVHTEATPEGTKYAVLADPISQFNAVMGVENIQHKEDLLTGVGSVNVPNDIKIVTDSAEGQLYGFTTRYQLTTATTVQDLMAKTAKHSLSFITADNTIDGQFIAVPSFWKNRQNLLAFTFDESNIIRDSVKTVQQRKTSDFISKIKVTFNQHWGKNQLDSDLIVKFNPTTYQFEISGLYNPLRTAGCSILGTLNNDPDLVRIMKIQADYFKTRVINEKDISCEWFFDDKLPQPLDLTNTSNTCVWNSLAEYVRQLFYYYSQEAWEISFSTKMDYFIYSQQVNKLSALTPNKLVLGDMVSYATWFTTDKGGDLDLKGLGFISSIKPAYYEGYAEVTLYSPIPPSVLSTITDSNWNGLVGGNSPSSATLDKLAPLFSYPFKDGAMTGYPTASQGAITPTDYQMTDNTYVDQSHP
jgi:hypothetical protein